MGLRADWLLFAMCASGCFATERILGDSDTVWFYGECRCVICLDPGPTPGSCNSPTTTDQTTVQICSWDPEVVFAHEALLALGARCEQLEAGPDPSTAVTQCDLVPFDDGTGTFVDYVVSEEHGVCKYVDRDRYMARTLPGGSRALMSSTIRATGPSFSAIANVTGEIDFSGGNCSSGTCPITISSLQFRSPGFDVTAGGSTTTVTDALVVNRTIGTGTCVSLQPAFNACGFLLDPSSLEIDITAVDGGSRNIVEAKNIDQGGGVIAFDSHLIAVNQVFQSGDLTVELTLTGTVDNFAPNVALPAPSTIACGRGAVVVGRIEDVDGSANALQISWLVDHARVQTGSNVLTHDLSPGTHLVEVLALDPDGGFSRASTTVTVLADTTPPIVSDGVAACVWPPNHDQRVFSDSELSLFATDECDAAPRIEFVGGASSQPDDGVGDGHTTNDLVVHPASVCVRNERQGVDPAGRTYFVDAIAIDSAGNRSAAKQVQIRVPHDQNSGRCDYSGGIAVDDEDPRCVPLPADPAPPIPPAGPRANAPDRGCSTGGFSGAAPMPLILLVVFRRRRRR